MRISEPHTASRFSFADEQSTVHPYPHTLLPLRDPSNAPRRMFRVLCLVMCAAATAFHAVGSASAHRIPHARVTSIVAQDSANLFMASSTGRTPPRPPQPPPDSSRWRPDPPPLPSPDLLVAALATTLKEVCTTTGGRLVAGAGFTAGLAGTLAHLSGIDLTTLRINVCMAPEKFGGKSAVWRRS